jgi:hypothetical protein
MGTVIVVLVLVVSVLYPRLVAMQAGAQSRADRASLLRLPAVARAAAIDRGREARLRYDVDERAFVAELTEDSGQDAEEVARAGLPEGAEPNGWWAGTFEVEAVEWEVAFLPDGRGSAGAFEVADPDGDYHVQIASDGRATLGDGPLDEAPGSDWEAGGLERRGS